MLIGSIIRLQHVIITYIQSFHIMSKTFLITKLCIFYWLSVCTTTRTDYYHKSTFKFLCRQKLRAKNTFRLISGPILLCRQLSAGRVCERHHRHNLEALSSRWSYSSAKKMSTKQVTCRWVRESVTYLSFTLLPVCLSVTCMSLGLVLYFRVTRWTC